MPGAFSSPAPRVLSAAISSICWAPALSRGTARAADRLRRREPGSRGRPSTCSTRQAVHRAIADVRPTTVYHCAGAAHVGMSWGDTARTLAINVRGTHNLLEGLRRAGLAARVVIPGSAMVYAAADRALTEDDPLVPRSPYALSKLAQEMEGVRANLDGLHVTIARAFNHMGPRQDPFFAASGFARRIADIEAGRWEPEIAVGNLDARRDLTDVRDTIRAYRLILERGTPGPSVQRVLGTRHHDPRTARPPSRARARADSRTRRRGAAASQRRAAAARGSNTNPDRTGLAARDPARPDARRSAGRLEKPAADLTRGQTTGTIGAKIQRNAPVRARRPQTHDTRHRADRQGRRRRRPDRRGPPRRPSPLSGSVLQIRSEPGQGHAVLQLDAQRLPRLHARLPLLLRAALPRAVRDERRRRVRVRHSREGQHRRRAHARARSPVVAAREGRRRHGDRPVSADRGPLPADAAVVRSLRARADAGRARDERDRWWCGIATCCWTSRAPPAAPST